MKFCTIPPFLSRISKLTRPDRHQVKTDSCRHPNRNRSFKCNFGLYVKMWLKARYPHIIPTQSIYKLSFAFVSKILNVFCVCRFSNFSLSFFLCCVCVFFQKFMILATVFFGARISLRLYLSLICTHNSPHLFQFLLCSNEK